MIEIGLEQVYSRVEDALNRQDYVEAENLLFPAMDQFPKDSQLLFYASHVLVKRERYMLAKLCVEESLRLSPNPRAYGNLGAIYRRMNDNVMAEVMLDRAIEYEPEEKNAWNNKAANYVNEGNPDPGIVAAKRALEIDPDFIKASWNLGLLLLEKGEFAEGWDRYRDGLALNDRMIRSYSFGEGDGPKFVESLDELIAYEGKPRCIVYGEQGIGDEIMFSTILEDFSKYAEIVFECHPRLIKIFQKSFPFIKEFYPTRKDDFIEWPLEAEKCPFKCSIGDLGRFLRRDRESFPRKACLKPDEDLVEQYRGVLEEIAPGKKFVGVAWTGGVLRTMRWYRSVQLPELYMLANDPDVVLVSLQYEDDTEALDQFIKQTGKTILRFPAITQHYDYDHTLALVMALDEVVSVCQSVAHLSAAAGQVTRVLVPDKPAWRYGLTGDDWYWYGENAKLYRRESTAWDDAILRLAADMGVGPMPAHEMELLRGSYAPGDTMLELGCKQFDRYKRWFESQGVEHTSVDLNGEGGALALDLQEPLNLGQFDIVTNFGTTEHVENQEPVWRNIHEALKPGGILISTTPFPGDWPDHGMWYPSGPWYENFLKGLGYKILGLGVSGESPRRMVCVKAQKVAERDFVWTQYPMHENKSEKRKVGAYV